MIFRKRQKVPLEQAITFANQAIDIAYTYKRDPKYYPTATDLALFKQLHETLWSHASTAAYIERCMQQRAAGEPEGAKKFTDPAVADYHYPLR